MSKKHFSSFQKKKNCANGMKNYDSTILLLSDKKKLKTGFEIDANITSCFLNEC